MAPINPPTYLQAGTYPARLDRLMVAGLMTPQHSSGALAIRPGVKPTPSNTGFQVTQQSTPAMGVTVGAGMAYLQSPSATGGTYLVANDASHNVAILSAHATLGRRDIIVARIYDSEISGASNEFTIEAVTGSPAGSPVAPATPAGALLLATVLVPAASSSVTNANITDNRSYTAALGGTIPAPGSALPTSPYEGMAAYNMTTDRPVWWNGSAWRGWTDEGYITSASLSGYVTTSQLNSAIANYLTANGYVTSSQLSSYVTQASLTSQLSGYLTSSSLDSMGWTSWSPNWGASSSNPSIGNGDIVGRYFKIGKMVIARISQNMGSTTGFGGGYYSWSVPFTPSGVASGAFAFAAGSAVLNDSGTGQRQAVPYIFDLGGSNYRIRLITSSDVEVAHNVPFTWASGDDLDITVVYQAA